MRGDPTHVSHPAHRVWAQTRFTCFSHTSMHSPPPGAQMKGMSDTQMKVMMKAATVVQKGAKAVQKTREALLSRTALLVAIAVVLLALLLRYLGIM